jgi:hypothetical protein
MHHRRILSAGHAQILVCRSHLLSSVKTYVGTQGSRNVMSSIVIMEAHKAITEHLGRVATLLTSETIPRNH